MAVGLSQTALDEIERGLHDLAQPLTALQCRLELGILMGDPDALLEAATGALVDTGRMFAEIGQMRERLFGAAGPHSGSAL
jgi:hypothetical protein